jgi:hypothetical protein
MSLSVPGQLTLSNYAEHHRGSVVILVNRFSTGSVERLGARAPGRGDAEIVNLERTRRTVVNRIFPVGTKWRAGSASSRGSKEPDNQAGRRLRVSSS